MSTSRVLQHLYSLDNSSPDLLRYLYYLIQNDDEERYLSSLQGSESARLVDFFDSVRPSLLASFQLTSQTPQVLDVIPITVLVSLGRVIERWRIFLLCFFPKQRSRHPEVNKVGIKHWLNRPLEHLNIYPIFFEAVPEETTAEGRDVRLLKEAVNAMRNLQLKAFQTTMGKGSTGRFEWHDLVPEDVTSGIPKEVAKRQA